MARAEESGLCLREREDKCLMENSGRIQKNVK